jgi:hypothetical protein
VKVTGASNNIAHVIAPGKLADIHRWDSAPKIRFAPDSPLEGTGFELLLPLPRQTPGVIAGISPPFPPSFPLQEIRQGQYWTIVETLVVSPRD